MKQSTKETVLKALESRIRKTTERLRWKENVVEDCERQLRTKQGTSQAAGNGLVVTFEYDESIASEMHQEALIDVERCKKMIAEFEDAMEDIKNNY